MFHPRVLAAAIVAAALWTVSTPLTHAASSLLIYKLNWESNHTVSLQGPNGTVQKRLTRGQYFTIRKGSDLLTVSLRSVTPSATSALIPAVSPVAQQVLGAINAARFARHVPLLTLDPQQSACSASHSTHMAQVGTISHDQFPADVCVAYTAVGENVGEAAGDLATAAIWLHHSMMAEGPCPHTNCSSGELEEHGHYLNIVNPAYRKVGIGIVVKNGVTWLTEDFTG